MRTTSQQSGDAAEQLVVDRLVARGWTVLARNVHVGRAELDIVAVDPDPPARLVIVEVRMRRSREFGLAEETVGRAKRVRLRHAAQALRERGLLADGTAIPPLPLRLDLIVVEPAADRRSQPVIRHHLAAL